MMAQGTQTVDLASVIGPELPYLRRYARALTGSQESGDSYAAATLEAILGEASVMEGMAPKTALFRTLHTIWSSSRMTGADGATGSLERAARAHLDKLTANTREALLLHTIEGFPFGEIATIMVIDQAEAEHLVRVAHDEMAESIAGRVLIIEDEPIIAMDIETMVSDLGHQITGVARTRAQAVRIGAADRPDLILADIHLADNSSGIDAVNDLLAEFGSLPVIFITAYPERLLTGKRPEPAFLITKPYTEDQVKSAVSQAMFFSSTETLKV